MKEAELRKHAICALCHKPIGNAGVPFFWTATIERHGIKMDAVYRQQGLGMMIGAQLAMVMGPDEELTMPLMDPLKVTICEACGTKSTCIGALASIEEHSI